jgi:hypothetical protein
VIEGATTSDIDASLALLGRIAGTVTGPDGVTPLKDIQVNVYQNVGGYWGWVALLPTPAVITT